MSHTAAHIMSLAATNIKNAGGITNWLLNYGYGGIAMAMILQIIEGINSAGTVLLGLPRALGMGMIALIDGTLGGMLLVVDAGTAATVRSFADGIGALLGIFAQPASIGIAMLSLAVFIWAVNRLSISPLSFIQSVRN